MKLKFFKMKESVRNAKATVHSSGKLGFSADAILYLGIKEGKYILFAQNEEDEQDLNLYFEMNDNMHEDAFRINKAGEYFYVNTKFLFDSLSIDYKKTRVVYDLIKFNYEGKPMVKMLRRELKKKTLPVQTKILFD